MQIVHLYTHLKKKRHLRIATSSFLFYFIYNYDVICTLIISSEMQASEHK